LFAGNHLLTAPKPMSECYVTECFVRTVAQRSVCVKARQRRSANLGFRTLHAEQQHNTFMSKYCRYISALFCWYDTSATLSIHRQHCRLIYIGVPIHRSSS